MEFQQLILLTWWNRNLLLVLSGQKVSVLDLWAITPVLSHLLFWLCHLQDSFMEYVVDIGLQTEQFELFHVQLTYIMKSCLQTFFIDGAQDYSLLTKSKTANCKKISSDEERATQRELKLLVFARWSIDRFRNRTGQLRYSPESWDVIDKSTLQRPDLEKQVIVQGTWKLRQFNFLLQSELVWKTGLKWGSE